MYQSNGHSGFILHAVTRFYRHGRRKCRYCRSKYLPLAGTSSVLRNHLPPHTRCDLESPRERNVFLPRRDARLPQLNQLPVSNAIFNHAWGLTGHQTSPYYAGKTPLSRRIRFTCYVSLTSYGFLQTPPLPVTPLPFGLFSPRSGCRLQNTGRVCQLCWANANPSLGWLCGDSRANTLRQRLNDLMDIPACRQKAACVLHSLLSHPFMP